MGNIAKIAVSAAVYAIDKPYSYAVDSHLAVLPGVRVMVPFGKGNRMTEGIVLAVETGSEAELKRVDRVLDREPVLDDRALRLAAFLRERYFCTYYEAARVMLPAGLWFRVKEEYTLNPDRPWQDKTIRQKDAAAILQILDELGGIGEYSQIQKTLPDEQRLRAALKYLLTKKWITTTRKFSRKAGDKTEKIAVLAASDQEAMEYAGRKAKIAPIQHAVLDLLCKLGACSVKELCYYTGATAATISRLEKLGYISLRQQEVLRCRQIRPMKLTEPLTLNAEQQRVFLELREKQQSPAPLPALLYGITGSGKTSVYIKLIENTLAQGKSAILMVPEIGLTPQLLRLMTAYFGDDVAVVHSSLSIGERYDQWKRIQSGAAKLVVGTRSAVFAPCQNLGLIVLDEEQDHSYRSENSPRYSTREVALYRGYQQNALVLLGSATPSVESMFCAKIGRYSLHRLNHRYNGMALPKVDIVDMKAELRAGNDSILSRPLQEALTDTFANGEQAVLFLNRRGASRMLQCVSCGEVPECPRCSVHLTYHSANSRVMCHYCGFSAPMPKRCPHCSGILKPVGVGTQRVQQELEERFPGIRVARMDGDTVSAVNTHEAILERFQSEKMNVLLGTQMVTKGLNLPDVTLVGVLDADMSLYVNSFRAAETTFHILTQVVGRAGRGSRPGKALIQTMTPAHQVICLASQQDYDSFYALEVGLREVKGCPPFRDIYTITFSGLDEGRVLWAAACFRDSLDGALRQQPELGDAQVLGPAPAVVAKINYNYRYCLTLRGQGGKPMRRLLSYFLGQLARDRNNRGVTAFIDVNGFDG